MSEYWLAPAKINLFLHINRRRLDGYHELQTAFQFLSLVDRLYFNVSDTDSVIHVHNESSISETEDLAFKAAQLLKKVTDCHHGARITVEKNIPIGGGLGGGSSDAATVLMALNILWKTGLGIDELSKIGLNLGADVPIFLHGRAAWAEGIGEHFIDIEPRESIYVVIKPDACQVSTKDIFNASELKRDTPKMCVDEFKDQSSDTSMFKNDCEAVVRKYYPEIDEALNWLNQFANARLTGTGACVFARCDDRSSAQKIVNQLPHAWQGYTVQGLNHSPFFSNDSII